MVVTCWDGSCVDNADDCPDAPDTTCADAGGNQSWIADGWCDTINNNADCGFDGGDCCPTECAEETANNCPENPDGCYSNCADGTCCGDCATCEDPDDADLAEGGACYDYEVWTDAECAATLTVSGSSGVEGEECYSDGSGYYVFDWEGGCLATLISYSEGDLDLAAYGFTGGFSFYGFEPGTSDDFIVYFGDAFGVGEGVTNDCPAAATCEDQGLVTCDDGSCAAGQSFVTPSPTPNASPKYTIKSSDVPGSKP
jgi:hypothetical protein